MVVAWRSLPSARRGQCGLTLVHIWDGKVRKEVNTEKRASAASDVHSVHNEVQGLDLYMCAKRGERGVCALSFPP